jgi:hypothetical protein
MYEELAIQVSTEERWSQQQQMQRQQQRPQRPMHPQAEGLSNPGTARPARSNLSNNTSAWALRAGHNAAANPYASMAMMDDPLAVQPAQRPRSADQ